MLFIWASAFLIAICHAQEPALVGSEVKILSATELPPSNAPLRPESPEQQPPPAQGQAPNPNEPAAQDPFANVKISNSSEGALKPEEALAKFVNATNNPKEPELNKPEGEKPELGKPELGKPELGKPELGKPELGKPESEKPEAKPEAGNASIALELEQNATLSNEQKEKKEENASLPLGEKLEEAPHANGSLPLKPLGNNETLVDLGAKGKNDSEVINELLLNTSSEAIFNSSARFLLPSRIERVRLTIIGFTGKPVHTFNLTDNQILYQMKVFWGEPESWQDIGYPANDRLYELFCWLTVHGGFARDLFRGNVSAALDQHAQWYAFPEAEDPSKSNISVNCGMRPVNAAGKGGDWSFADPAPVREAPVFLRGFENVNVRGWTKEEVVRLIRNQKRHDSVGQSGGRAAQAKSKSKNRRS